MWYVYILKSDKDKKFYTGLTNDLRKRLKHHSDGNSFSTRSRRPFALIYYEACVARHDAAVREQYLKSGMGKRYIQNRIKRFLSLTG